MHGTVGALLLLLLLEAQVPTARTEKKQCWAHLCVCQSTAGHQQVKPDAANSCRKRNICRTVHTSIRPTTWLHQRKHPPPSPWGSQGIGLQLKIVTMLLRQRLLFGKMLQADH
jgi:hypothetical protein